MRPGLRFALLSVALGLAFPGSAAAFGQLSSFGEFGGGPGQLDAPKQMAVAPDGDVYVADSGNDRISVFAGDGSFLRTFGEGKLLEPEDVALDDGGRAFIADSGHHRIAIFSSGGSFLYAFGEKPGEGELIDPTGVDVDASIFGSTVYVADSDNNLIASYAPGGSFIHSFGSVSSPRDVIVGGGGDLFVADFDNERVAVFSKEGEPIRSIGEGGAGALSGPVALVADGTGGIYVADRTAERVEHFDDVGSFLGGVAAEPNVAGVGVACQGNVFATESATSLARVLRFGEAGTPPPPCKPVEPEPIVDPGAKLPSNKFHFAGLVKKRSNGFAVLYVRVPGPGKVSLTGRGFRRLSRTARQATTVSLPIKPKVRLRHFLKQHGKGRIRVEVTFTPTDGEPRKREKVIVLKRNR
jgi:DNA-binding beta-propeller fold protein YncE